MPNGYNSSSKISVADRKSKKWKERLQSVGYAQSAVEVKIGNNTGDISKPGKLAKLWCEVISSCQVIGIIETLLQKQLLTAG